MSPEDVEEVKKIVSDKLAEEEKVISPLFNIVWIYKDVNIPEGQEDIIADAKIEEAETVKINRTIKWSDLNTVCESTKKNKDLFQVRSLYKIGLHSGEFIYCIIKDVELFKQDWEEFILAYGTI